MDPTQTLIDALRAIDTEDLDGAVTALNSLADWLDSGGFYPELSRAIVTALPDRSFVRTV